MVCVVCLGVPAGAYKSAGSALFVYEPFGCGHLAVRAGSLRVSFNNHVYRGPLLALRVAQSAPLRARERRGREPIFPVQLVLVRHWNLDATRLRPQPQGTDRLHALFPNFKLRKIAFQRVSTPAKTIRIEKQIGYTKSFKTEFAINDKRLLGIGKFNNVPREHPRQIGRVPPLLVFSCIISYSCNSVYLSLRLLLHLSFHYESYFEVACGLSCGKFSVYKSVFQHAHKTTPNISFALISEQLFLLAFW